MEIELYVHDNSIETPWLSKSFCGDIFGGYHITFADFLTNEERQVLSANTWGEIILGKKREATTSEKFKAPFILQKAIKGEITVEGINKLRDKIVHRSEKIEDRERDPVLFKQALFKLHTYLEQHPNKLPVVHTLHLNKLLDDASKVDIIEIHGITGHVEGDNYWNVDNYPEVREKINIRSYWEDTGKINLWLDISPQIEIDGKIYYSKTVSKLDIYQSEFQQCFDFLDKAISQKKKILWEI